MSVAAMARFVQERQEQEQTAQQTLLRRGLVDEFRPLISVTAPEEAKRTVTTTLERLTGFIPTEVVAGWGAAVGLLAPEKSIGSWAIFFAALLFLVILLLLETAVRDKKSATRTGGRRKLLMILVAAAAFTIWVFASPGSPAAAQWGTEMMRYFGVAAIAVSAVLFKLSQLLGLAPLE